MSVNLFKYTIAETKTIERIVADENVNINHMILPQGDRLPQHYSNSNVYMIVARGVIDITLDDSEVTVYKKGDIINIPFNKKMDVINTNVDTVELFVVKAPAPENYKA